MNKPKEEKIPKELQNLWNQIMSDLYTHKRGNINRIEIKSSGTVIYVMEKWGEDDTRK